MSNRSSDLANAAAGELGVCLSRIGQELLPELLETFAHVEPGKPVVVKLADGAQLGLVDYVRRFTSSNPSWFTTPSSEPEPKEDHAPPVTGLQALRAAIHAERAASITEALAAIRCNPWSGDGWNLTSQGLIEVNDPERATRLRAEAGVFE